MNNEVLAILLKQYRNQLSLIRSELLEALSKIDGIEYHKTSRQVWKGEESKEPWIPPFHDKDFMNDNYKTVEEEMKNFPVLLENLVIFIISLGDDIDTLIKDEDNE